jgi:hypothetical protein
VSQQRSEVIQVVQGKEAVFYMTVDYEEGDIGHATGSLYSISTPRPDSGVASRVLASNDTFSTLWLSPQGSLWVGSADGRVATTAPTSWPTGSTEGAVIYDAERSGLRWTVTDLPPVRGTGLPPNITAMWGISDEDVFLGTRGGHIYQWQGSSWIQTHEGPGKGKATVYRLGGSSARDVFAVGKDQLILHYDGSVWAALQAPGADNGSGESMTGVVTLPDGSVFISASGNQGRLLHGTAASLVEFGRYAVPLIGMARLDDRILFAVGEGCAELSGQAVQVIKNNFKTVGVMPGLNRVFFLEPDQPQPAYVDYDPSLADRQWRRVRL